MAALADGDFTSQGEIGDIVPTEFIPNAVEGFNLPINIGHLFVSEQAGQGYYTHQFGRWADPTFPDPIRAAGETDTLPRIEFATASSTITPVLKGVQMVIPDEPIESQKVSNNQGVPLGTLRHLIRKVMEYIDQDILDTAQAATETVGTAATVPSFAQWRTCMHAYKLLENDGQYAFVGNHYFWEKFTDEFTTATSTFSDRLAPRVLSGGKSSFRGTMLDFDLFESAHVSEEAGGANNFMIATGAAANKIIGYVNQRRLRVEFSRGDEMQRRQASQWTVSWADGVGLLRTDGLLECLMDAAA